MRIPIVAAYTVAYILKLTNRLQKRGNRLPFPLRLFTVTDNEIIIYRSNIKVIMLMENSPEIGKTCCKMGISSDKNERNRNLNKNS